MIQCFDKKYYAISNLFTQSCDGDFFTFPAPYHILLNSDFKSNNVLEISYANFYDSPFILDYIFRLFFYVLFYDGTIETIYLESVSLKQEPCNESYGYKGIYSFDSHFSQTNISKEQFYGKLHDLKQTLLPNPSSHS